MLKKETVERCAAGYGPGRSRPPAVKGAPVTPIWQHRPRDRWRIIVLVSWGERDLILSLHSLPAFLFPSSCLLLTRNSYLSDPFLLFSCLALHSFPPFSIISYFLHSNIFPRCHCYMGHITITSASIPVILSFRICSAPFLQPLLLLLLSLPHLSAAPLLPQRRHHYKSQRGPYL